MIYRRAALSLFLPLGFLLTGFGNTGCTTGKGAASGSTDAVQIEGTVTNCNSDSVRLFVLEGPLRNPVAAAALRNEDGKSVFTLNTTIPYTGLYAIGVDARSTSTVMLGDARDLTLTGDCANPQASMRLEGSSLNNEYQAFVGEVIRHNQKVQQLQQNMQIFSQSDPGQLDRLNQEILAENERFYATLDSALANEGIMGKVATMYNYRPFGTEPSHQKYADERAYFAAEFFTGFDPNDPEIGRLPQLFEKAQAYASTLPAIVSPEEAKQRLDAIVPLAEPGSLARLNILRGILAGLEQRGSEIYVDYGKQFVEQFPNDPMATQVSANIDRMSRLMPGSEAPDIADATPEGGSLALSDLRGQYVLIDFWASWCRPCRMENPNVVRAYNKYHPKGFEILGVSLDKDKNRWTQAIEQDGLPWKHISDLGGWQSKPASVYGVTSIPATFLVDPDGNIIAKNLRGPALEAKLAEIFDN